jgi:hypothetical protein
MKDNIKCKLIDVALAGENIGLSYDRHTHWVLYNASTAYDRVIFRWHGERSQTLDMFQSHPVPLKTALELVDAHWKDRLVQYSAEVYR